MKNVFILIFIFNLLLLQSCKQASNTSRKGINSSSATASGKTSNGNSLPPTFTTDETLYWFTTDKVVNTIAINKNSEDIIYLRGKLVHDFLNAKDLTGTEYYRKQYCLIGNFATTTYKQVRLRAIPIFITTSTKAIERLLRIDIASNTDSTAACQYTKVDETLPANAAFSLPGITTLATGQVTTTNLNLYNAKTSSIVKIETNLLNLAKLLIKIDLTSNATSSNSSCTNASCSAKGFDCCISGQCINDASEKSNATSNLQYTQAKIDYAANPLSFINYPNIFFICSNIAHTPPVTTTATNTSMSDAQKRVYQYANDWKCVTDYAASGTNTYYVNKIDNSFVSSLSGLDATKYNTILCNETYYTSTKKKLATSCGCTASDSERAIKCPDWGVVPVYKSGALQTTANITDFNCYTPAPVNPIGPITNLNVSVTNRSAPHRFYYLDSNNKTTQEGDDFYYLDEYNKAGPVNGSFNINSILGRMTVDLAHTNPAKEVTVELGKTYILSATSGYFTPCAKCAKDSWFQTFSANPISQRGTGLRATGYTTSRNTYSANTTAGNYEDTKFGRACFLPVTMIPLAHQKNGTLQTQRLNRLKTQSAFYINGYQRDWFGFNKGALIGSFDGVTWFAIGTGRRITATSTKLFLALNASFLDLADKTDTIVNIIPDLASNTASNYDYDPDIAINDPNQSTAATCQKYHQCETDTDCVSQLGWEYSCADVSQYKTNWPLYDSDGNELANQEKASSLFEILQNTISTSTNKRCVYRGSGAPCKRDYSTLNSLNKKTLTCAPNFYCASLTATNKFNDELVRSPNELDNILYGMDTNILGRPFHYISGSTSKSLTADIISNIKYNGTNAISLSSIESDDMGICLPGKGLSGVELTDHMTADTNPSIRTDYISQIGSCDSNAIDTNRFNTCPAFDDNLNYADPAALDILDQKQTQNSCGAEAKHTASFVSAFKNIEGLSLASLLNISEPTLARDACLRRAGSACHTDLDCGPNKMHEDAVGSIDIKYFGGTEAEKSYWSESLICGQGTPIPATADSGYINYQLNQNRCCREIGKDFSMVTQGPKELALENAGTNESVITDRLTHQDPTAANRYSRYAISKELINDTNATPAVLAGAEPKDSQWRVINETGSLTCCGGGWIRKFTDGTHDWKIKNRLSLDTANFNCLNFRSPLANSSYANFTSDKVVTSSYQREFEYFCKSPNEGGCFQIPFQDSASFAINAPGAYDPADNVALDFTSGISSKPTTNLSRLDTTPTIDPIDGMTPWSQLLNSDVPYSPLPFYFSPTNLDVDSTNNKAYNFFSNFTFDYGVEMYLPAYIGWDNTLSNSTFIKKIYIKYFYNSPTAPLVVDITAKLATSGQCSAVINATSPTYPIDGMPKNKWCISSSSATQNRPVINVRADNSTTWKYAGIIIDFKPIEQYKGTVVSEAGNALYYLSKLARLELIGIPQITYEPLYCNNNQANLVPGIFKSNIATRTNFLSNSVSYSAAVDPIERYNADQSINSYDLTGYGNYEEKFTYQDKLDHPAIFSSKDFTCCTPLGNKATSDSKCCTGYAVASICKMPKGTDLNVYFNKFVSSEGVGDSQPGGGLTIKGTDEEVDFNPYTGEPKYRGSTYDKLVALGAKYCDGGNVATGGAFGAFPPEPFSGSYTIQSGATLNSFPTSIVDSILDFQASDANVGKISFDSGFKWNHHYYCK